MLTTCHNIAKSPIEPPSSSTSLELFIKGLVCVFEKMNPESEFIYARNRVVVKTSMNCGELNELVAILVLRCCDHSSYQPTFPSAS